ncbi:glycosyltransferase [Bifidobacterium saguinibicoloris]|uniref:glycosyltransferase n=1 Tax=Bifidobacterium saguinibicoloris TaxID=2834433 RepID=UPI001C573F91|nr:glycosyltransferase [Bifidobacterium saguinibicoloris]MBW3081515.1 glycosyltransferase [Bifidobacterium saguinibicoloris]
MAGEEHRRDSSPIRILQWGMSPVYGGTETFIMNLYRHIDREKVQFDFLIDHASPPLAAEDEILSLGGHIYRVMYTRSERPFGVGKTLLGFYRSSPEIAGVHMHVNNPYATPLAVAKQADIPLRILHSHNGDTLDFVSERPLTQRLKSVIRNTIAHHDINTAVTDFFACSDVAAKFMFPGKPYRWIRNGIDTEHFAFDASMREKVRAELGIGTDTTVIGYCGRLAEQKNLLFLVDVFAEYQQRHSDSLLVVVGDGDLHDQIVQRAAERGLADRVRLLGDHKDVAPYYQAMDAFVLPSLYEGFPIVLQEAQCSGLPCLASTNMTATADTVELVRFRDLDDGAEAWADELRGMIVSTPRTDHSEQLRAAGFDMADVAREMERFYLEHARAR